MSYSTRLAICESFSVAQPDGDGLVWLHATVNGNGAMVNLGPADRIVAKVWLALEANRKAAIADDDEVDLG